MAIAIGNRVRVSLPGSIYHGTTGIVREIEPEQGILTLELRDNTTLRVRARPRRSRPPASPRRRLYSVSSYQIRVSLEVKANTPEEAVSIVDMRLDNLLNKWVSEPPVQPPYPNGTLLFYTITDGHRTRPLEAYNEKMRRQGNK
jgi:hypothetical protein